MMNKFANLDLCKESRKKTEDEIFISGSLPFGLAPAPLGLASPHKAVTVTSQSRLCHGCDVT